MKTVLALFKAHKIITRVSVRYSLQRLIKEILDIVFQVFWNVVPVLTTWRITDLETSSSVYNKAVGCL